MAILSLIKKNPARILSLFLFCLISRFSLQAQSADNGHFITLEVTEASLSDILYSITEQTGIRFAYNPRLIQSEAGTSLSIYQENIERTLAILLPDSITYKKIGNHIILQQLKKEDLVGIEDSLSNDTGSNTEGNSTPGFQTEEVLLQTDRRIHSDFIEKNTSSNTGKDGNNCLDSIIEKKDEEMKHYIAALLMAGNMAAGNITAQDGSLSDTIASKKNANVAENTGIPRKTAQLTFVYPLGTGWIKSPEHIYTFSVNVIGGVTGGYAGIELGSVFNINMYGSRGLQLAGVFNLTGVSGSNAIYSNQVQMALGFNYNHLGKSVQFAGGVNVADTAYFQGASCINIARTSYVQLAAGLNLTKNGKVQLSSGINIAESSIFQLTAGLNLAQTTKAQLSAGMNIAQSSRFQMTGGMNITQRGKGQISAGMNIAGESNFQLTAGINITGKGGFQMAVINVRDTADGVSLGLLNIVKKGGVLEFGIEGSEFIHTSATFRSGTRRLYTYLSAGANFTDQFWSAGIGLGTSFLWKNRFGLNLELIHYSLYGKIFRQYFPSGAYYTSYNGMVQFRPVFHLEIARHFKLFLGPSANLLIQSSDYGQFADIAPYSIVENTSRYARLNFWVGVSGGFKF